MKIRPELDVPDVDECGGCRCRFVNFRSDFCVAYCDEDGDPIDIKNGKKLPPCRAAEVQPYGWVVETTWGVCLIYRNEIRAKSDFKIFRRCGGENVQLFPVYKGSDRGVKE